MATVEKVSYTHDAMIDLLIEHPAISQRQLAEHFGYTEAWISQILSSDSIQARIAERKAELIDPVILQSMDTKLRALAQQSMEVLGEALQLHRSPDTALKVLEVTSRSLGYGAKAPGVQINQQFVAYMPNKSTNPETWLAEHKPAQITVDTVIDVPLTQ